MDDPMWEELGRALADRPGTWLAWPETFPDMTIARERLESARNGGIPAFHVDRAAFRWRVDEFHTTVSPDGRVHVEARCAW